ncbi:Meckelin [Fimicolochytrium jonesii]|uniref:Meckelin n=1 Tax=Fimicolochytrium jonesii TaxID=1396493 RepID=UPI0022FEEDD8|nr:Meckelin [Fimicolochytrium jonesii]KAI8826206.1 Meckelin [Fimicolochytrium jonesii]
MSELRGLPRIYYGLGTTLEDSTTVTSQVVTLPAGSDTLNLLLGAYTLNGTFLGYEPVGAQLQYCLQTPIDQTTAWLKIGHNFEGSCRVNLTSLLQGRAGVVFYQLYIRDATSTLLPIPIRLTNYRATGARQPNLDPDPLSYGSSTLFRRFFVTDGVSGVEGGVRRAVRGVQGVRVWIRKAPGARSVYIPVVDLTYFERDVSTLSGADGGSDVSFPQVTFEMHYTAPLDSFWKAVKIVFALVCVYAGFLALYRARAWSARNLGAGEGWDVQFFGRCIIILAGSLAPPVIFLLLGISAYWFFAFKNTANALDHLLPWSSGDLSTFSAVGVVALCCYALYILKELHAQCTADIFFIDWEQSKGRILRSGDEGKARLAPVSVWRSIFLMNVWDDIQTHRLVNIELNLLAMFFILDTLQVRYAATPQPDRQDLTPGPTSPILLFGVEGMVWLALSAAQALFRHLVHDRFYRNRLLNFIDVLSMANLSVFAFDEQCHGYYIHGKSVHQCADTSVAELNGFLRKEQADLVPRRGLQGSDQQCFEVLAQKEFRAAFNKVYRAVIADLDRGDGAAARAQRLTMEPRARRFTGADEERVRAYETVNHFLKSFFDQNLKDYPYVIRTRTYFERFLAKTPDVSHTSVLFHDTTATPFTPLLLRGLEPHLLLLYALLFTLVSQAVDSTGVAVVVVYGVDVAVRCGRRHFGRGNVGRKGLMDGKFLV